jgi:hypothetical protein
MLFGRWNVGEGIGREIIVPKKDMFASHLVERRGSRVRAAADQYLVG